jgi:Na+/proline symporter
MDVIVTLHNIWRWVVLLVGLGAIVFAVMAASGSRPWDGISDRLSFCFTLSRDIQLWLGIIVWIGEQRWDGANTFLSFIHPLAMIVAVAVAHFGRRRSDSAAESRDKGRQASIFFILSLLVILVAIPIAAWPL